MARPKLSKAFDKFGASMGRRNVLDDLECHDEPKWSLYKMPINDGGYDSGGAYWGIGSRTSGVMFHAYCDGPKFVNHIYIRSVTRLGAKQKIRELFSGSKFYR